MLNREKFYKDFLGLCEYFGDEPTDAKAEIYWKALKSLSESEWSDLQENLITYRKYRKLPLVAEMLESIHGNPEEIALRALVRVEKAIREVGTDQTVCFDDKVIHGAVCAFEGGWRKIGLIPLKQWTFDRKEFVKIYMALASDPNRKHPNKLIGETEHQNETSGWMARMKEMLENPDPKKKLSDGTRKLYEDILNTEPVFIGDKAKARLIYEGKGEEVRIENEEVKMVE